MPTRTPCSVLVHFCERPLIHESANGSLSEAVVGLSGNHYRGISEENVKRLEACEHVLPTPIEKCHTLSRQTLKNPIRKINGS